MKKLLILSFVFAVLNVSFSYGWTLGNEHLHEPELTMASAPIYDRGNFDRIAGR